MDKDLYKIRMQHQMYVLHEMLKVIHCVDPLTVITMVGGSMTTLMCLILTIEPAKKWVFMGMDQKPDQHDTMQLWFHDSTTRRKGDAYETIHFLYNSLIEKLGRVTASKVLPAKGQSHIDQHALV